MERRHTTQDLATARSGGTSMRIVGLEYEDDGDGDAVLFIHGAIVADALAPLAGHPALDGFRRVRYRRRGYRNSDRFASEPTMECHAADARALLRALGIARAHVVAHSGGGPVAAQLAVDAPDCVRSLVLLEPAFFVSATAAAFVELVSPLVDLYGAGEGAKAAHLWMQSVGGRSWRSEIEAHLPGAAVRAEVDIAATFDGDVRAIGAWDFDAVRGRFHQPVLLIAGSLSAATAEPAAVLLREAVDDLHEVVIEGANHMNVVLHPVTGDAIADFVRRQP